MDSSDTLKNFLKGIQKDDSPSKVNLANLKKWERQLKKLSHVAQPESFMKCVIKFIDFVVNYATSQSPQNQHSLCKDSFGILKEMITPELKNIFVRQVTKRVFDIIIEENAASWCMKRELLKVFNHCIESSDKMVRNKTVGEFSDMYIYKMVDSISSFGDYDLQVQLIETVFRMYGQITINSRLKDLIPESQELSQSFAEINDETFDEDIRTFLNNLNKTSGKLFSIVCESIKVGDIVCQPVTNSIDGLWVDFNIWESTITWYCSTNSFLENPNNEEEEVVWNLVTLFVSDIETVNIHCSADNSSFIIYCKLSGSCLSSGDYQDILDKANNLSILVKSSQAANILITEVLPCLFGKKIQQTSHRDLRKKVSTMSEYKALNIKFKRRAKSISSRCKSDVTCTTSLFDPTSARSTTTKSEESALSKNRSMDQTRPSVSSRSSNIEVITIDSSAEQRKHSARLLSVITEQDERVPGNECSNDAISIDSSGTSKSINLAEAPHIQIFSGRCCGSKMNFSRLSRDRVCSTTKKVSTHEMNLIETEQEYNNKVSQAEIYETAQDSSQFKNLTKIGISNILDSRSEEIYSSDHDSQKTVIRESYNDYKSCQSMDENYLKTINIETHETGKLNSLDWLAASAKFHSNSNLLSDCLLKKYSLNCPEMTEDYDSVKVNISTDNRLRVLENHNEERRPVNFKVSTAGLRDIENINPLSSMIECGNQKAAQSKKTKLSQTGKMEVLDLVSGKEKKSLDFEDKLILTSEAIAETPLNKEDIDNVKVPKKVSKVIDEEINNERSPDELYFNSLEVNIFEDKTKTRQQSNSAEEKSVKTSRKGSEVDIINRSNEISKEKKNVIKKHVKRKSAVEIDASKQNSTFKVSRNVSDNDVRQSKLDEILQTNIEILTCMEADAQPSSEDRKMHQDMGRTKTKREIYKEKKTIIEEDEQQSIENVQADENTLPAKVSRVSSNNELKLSQSDGILQKKEKAITYNDSNAQASSKDSKRHQDVNKTTSEKEIQRSGLTSKDKTKKDSKDSPIASKLDKDKEKVSHSNIRQVKKPSVFDSKLHETAECDKGKKEHEPQNNLPKDKLKSNIVSEIETRKHFESNKNLREHAKERKGDSRKETDDSDKQNQDIFKTFDLSDIELAKEQNEATQQVLEKVMPRDVNSIFEIKTLKRHVFSVNVESDKLSPSKSRVDSIEKILTHQTHSRSKRDKGDFKTIVDVDLTLKKPVADKIDLDKEVSEKSEDIVSEMRSVRNDQLIKQKDPYMKLNQNKIGKDKVVEIPEQKLIIANNNEQLEFSKLTEEFSNEKLPITTQNVKKERSSRLSGLTPKKKQTKSTLKKGSKLRKSILKSSEDDDNIPLKGRKLRKSILESSEDDDNIPLKGSKLRKSILESSEDDDNIPLSEVRKNLSKKTNFGQEVSSLKKRLFKHEESPSVTMSNTGIVPALKGCEKNEELGYENIMKKVDELDKLEPASLNDQNDNEAVYIPLEEQVNKVSSTGRKVTDKSASSEDSFSNNMPTPDLSAPMVRIDPDKAFENLLRTSSVTNHAALKKVRVGLTRIASDSSGELLCMKTPSQETNMELKGTKDDELDKHIQEIFEHPDSPIQTTDAVESTKNIDGTEKIISSEEKVIELITTLESPIDPACKENKEAVTEINVTKDAIEKDSIPLLEKNKKNVKFERAPPAKRSEEQEIFPNEMKDPNQTLSTTLSGRRRRKLFNPDDLSYLNLATDPVSPASFDISENSNKTLKVTKHGFLNRFLNGSDGPKTVGVVSDELVPKETNNPIGKGVGKVNIGQSIDRDSGAVFTGIVPLKKRTEMSVFGIGLLKEETKTKKPRKSTSKNEISYRDIKKVQDQDNKKRFKTVNLNTSIINSSGKSHLKSFFENMLDSFRDEMGGESILEKLNKNKVKETKPEKKSKRSTNRLSDTGDKKLRENRKSDRKSKTSSEQPKKRREIFNSTSLKTKPAKTNQNRRSTRNIFSSSPSLKLPKRFSQSGHQTPQKSHFPEENNNLPSDLTPDRNTRKRSKPFEDTPSVQKETEDYQTDGAGAGKINILSDIRIRPGWDDDASPPPKKIKIIEGPHLDNETIRENFSQERDLENADNTLSTQVSPYPILVSKHAPSWQGVALLDDKIVTLKSTDYLKKYLVLFFYPIDFGTLPYVCDPTEIISFNSRIEDFRCIDVEIVACSVDSFFTHNVWVRHLKQEGLLDKLEIPLLSDANHHISKAYKIYSDHLGHTFRGVFIIDPNGIVVQEMKVGLLSRIDVDIFFNWLKSIQSPN